MRWFSIQLCHNIFFPQAGPLYYVKIPKDRATGRNKSFAFVCYRHSVSVPYAIELMNGIAVYGRNLKVQSRNQQHLQQQGANTGPGGVHSLDPSFGKADNLSRPSPSQHCGQQGLLQSPSLLGMPGNNMMAMAQQQMALLNAFQPIPLSANPLLNAPRERYSDRHGSISYNRSSPYQRGSYSNDHRSNYSNSRESSYNSNRDSKGRLGAVGDVQQKQGRFDYNRLGPSPGRDHHSHYNNDHHKRQDDRYDRQRSGSHHSQYNTPRRSDGYHDRHHRDNHSSRNYRH